MSLSIEKGSITAILGCNGCGKTTLLDCLIGFNKPSAGRILIFNRDISDFTPKEFAKHISYVPQSIDINLDYKVSEFILFGRTCHLGLGEFPGRKDEEIMKESAKRFNLTHLLDKDINKVSGGERQLCYLARAVCQESEIIIMDEPTSALDFGNQAKFLHLIKSLKDEGNTVVFTTHNPNHVMELGCDALMMKDGSILFAGNSKEVMTEKNVKSLYGEGVKLSSDGTYFTLNLDFPK